MYVLYYVLYSALFVGALISEGNDVKKPKKLFFLPVWLTNINFLRWLAKLELQQVIIVIFNDLTLVFFLKRPMTHKE